MEYINIVKIGGSLTYFSESLLNELKSFSNPKNKIIIIPGGGKFANVVRELDTSVKMRDRTSHKLALLSMDMMGIYFSELSDIETVNTLYDAKEILKKKNIVILLPSKIVLSTDELPNSWEVTSDSVAAYITKLLKLNRLIIVTDVDGIYDRYPEGKLLNTINAKFIKGFTSVDSYLKKLLLKHSIECFVVNGKYPHRVINILKNNKDIYTKITVDL
ncbi:MAG TPA: hypothetical protein EYG76_05165 [Methanothermococcus okinawensis]|uniref:Aspartate/glutamate/uridylate kinase domain-containing protein n=1 Tax=Methanothermococcus okinawensis TaxID=155863 RepID=A0A833DQR7_9EURY|nr:hypothetical protein [Methanothermococcus okinawensis]